MLIFWLLPPYSACEFEVLLQLPFPAVSSPYSPLLLPSFQPPTLPAGPSCFFELVYEQLSHDPVVADLIYLVAGSLCVAERAWVNTRQLHHAHSPPVGEAVAHRASDAFS